MKNLKNLIIIVLAGMVIMFYLDENCTFNWYPSTCQIDTIIQIDTITLGGFHCDDTNRYHPTTDSAGGGKLVTENDAKAMMTDFTNQFHTGAQKGVTISKRALDKIFDGNETSNTLICYFAYSNADSKIHLVFEPFTSEYNQIDPRAGQTIPANNYFYSEGFCPYWCGVLGM